MVTPGGKQRTISSFFAPKQASQKSSIVTNSTTTPTAADSTKPVNSTTKSTHDTVGNIVNERGVPAITKTSIKESVKEIIDRENSDRDDDDGIVPPSSRLRRRCSKRTLSDDDGEDDEDDKDGEYKDLYSTPLRKSTKRLRRSPSSSVELYADEGSAGENDFLAPPKPKSSQRSPVPPAAETSRFRYDPSQMDVDVAEDPERKKQKVKLREKFVKKLGRVEILSRDDIDKDKELPEETTGEQEDPEEEELGPIAKRFGKGVAVSSKKSSSKTAGPKLTPLEKQVVAIKHQYPDTVLVVEVGYKFRFFGEDARIASQNLSIMCIPGKMRFDNHPSEAHLDRFASASIPVPRLHVHVKRLITAGLKVGVVRQLETAALKAAGDNKSAPFERKLTNLYTKGTYIDDIDAMDGGDWSSGAGSGGAPNTGFLLCLTEKPGGGSGADERVQVGFVAVQPSTGEVIYDDFEDGFMRSEIETRLLHIAPCEFLIVGELTKPTEKIVSHLAGGTTTILGDIVRVERVEKNKGAEAEASTHVSRFYANKVQTSDPLNSSEKNKLLDTVLDLSALVTLCLSAMIKHLSNYGLEHVFDLTKYFQSFSGRSHMLLNGNTLSSLEIYRNQTDYNTKGSLFWTLDRTTTKFGRRLLRNWVGRPLLDRYQLEERVNAVEEIANGSHPKWEKLKELLKKISYDLEKGLIRIYYGKCTRPELLAILQTMYRISTTFEPVQKPEDIGFKSNTINQAIASLPEIREVVQTFLGVFNHQAAGRDDKYEFFKESDMENDEYEAIYEHKLGISAVEADLEQHRQEISKILKGRKVNYMTISGIEYLVEVPTDKATLNKVPASWVKINGTKKFARFHTPEVIAMLRERDQHKESLAAECDKAYKLLLSKISAHYQQFRDCVHSLATLDCILSLATVANQPNYVKPTFTSSTTIDVQEGRHPMVEQLLLDAYVPNDIHLSHDRTRAMLVTGPNMGGKSSYVRQIALISIMAQIGSYVPAKSAKLGLLDAVFTRMGAFDNMMTGESTFMVELSETSDILRQATPRSLVILDELGRGTSTHDGVAIAHAVLDYVVRDLKSLLLFVTHYPLLASFAANCPDHVTNTHMSFEEDSSGTEGEDANKVTFLYKVAEGVAHRSYGLNVARLAGLPASCLEIARVKSAQLESETNERKTVRWATSLFKILESGDEKSGLDEVDVEALVKSLDFVDA